MFVFLVICINIPKRKDFVRPGCKLHEEVSLLDFLTMHLNFRCTSSVGLERKYGRCNWVQSVGRFIELKHGRYL